MRQNPSKQPPTPSSVETRGKVDPADPGCLPGWNGTSRQEEVSPVSSAPYQDQQGMKMGWRNTKYRADKGPGCSMASDGEDLRATK